LGGWVLAGSACQSSKPVVPPALASGWLPSQARVIEVRGPGGRGQDARSSWRKLRPGDWLLPGALIETAESCELTLQIYEPGVKVEVKAGSRLRLETLSYQRRGDGVVTSTLLQLEQGRVEVDNSHLTPGSDFEVRTPTGTTRIPPPAQK
jgi:hypothetical protein